MVAQRLPRGRDARRDPGAPAAVRGPSALVLAHHPRRTCARQVRALVAKCSRTHCAPFHAPYDAGQSITATRKLLYFIF